MKMSLRFTAGCSLTLIMGAVSLRSITRQTQSGSNNLRSRPVTDPQ